MPGAVGSTIATPGGYSSHSQFVELRDASRHPFGRTPWYHYALRVASYLIMIAGCFPLIFYVAGSFQEKSPYPPSPGTVLSGLLLTLLCLIVGVAVGSFFLVSADIAKGVRSSQDGRYQ